MKGHRLGTACLVVLLGVAALAAGQDGPDVVTNLTLFAGTDQGLWRSADWGQTWELVEGGTAGDRLDALGAARAIEPRGPEVWVAGDGGLYVSRDFGVTWTSLSPTGGISSLLLSRWPHADPTVFVGTEAGLLRSRDGGRSFAPTALTAGPVHRLEWPGPALVVAAGAGLLVTENEGETFSGPGPGLPEGGALAMALSSFFGADPVLFAAPTAGGVYRSEDGGSTWSAAGLDGEVVHDLVWLGPFLYAAGESGFFRSDNAGQTWTRLCDSPGKPRRLMFPLAPAAGLEAFLATDRGLFHTSDAGQHWSATGFEGEAVFTVATFPPPAPELGGKE
ncbi:MAG: hypothetical protein LJF30_13295 [Acidobacteria bacterium]|jgi:photosystem II stability/assembly factor-like uncharacterized protein|nr:hypothetical protein [Acidobacteriota bacterium]